MTVLVIAANNLRRLIRERGNLFFVFALPLLLILVLGLTVTNYAPRIGVLVEGELTAPVQELIDGLERLDGTEVVLFDGLGEATDELEREDITALVVVPTGYDETLAAGDVAKLEYRVIPTSDGFETQSLVQSVVADQNATLRASRLVSEQTGLTSAEADGRVAAVDQGSARVDVTTVDTDGQALSRC